MKYFALTGVWLMEMLFQRAFSVFEAFLLMCMAVSALPFLVKIVVFFVIVLVADGLDNLQSFLRSEYNAHFNPTNKGETK